MRLTTFSDYALRVLMYAATAGERLITIEETAKTYDVSRAHLMKVVNILTRTGYLKGVRGRSGGFTLAKPPEAAGQMESALAAPRENTPVVGSATKSRPSAESPR